MKKTLLSLAAVALAGSMMAQENRASAGLELGLPLGTFGTGSGFGIGATLGYELPVGDNLGLMAQLGYISFLGKDYTSVAIVNGFPSTVTVKSDAAGMIPIQIGGKYYFTDNQEGFYVGALLGVHMQSVKEVTGINLTTGEFTEESKLKTNFSYAPLLGYMVTENIDIALRFQTLLYSVSSADLLGNSVSVTTGYSYMGLRAAYMFGER
jgi:Outer membrane protein beta-barrel domain